MPTEFVKRQIGGGALFRAQLSDEIFLTEFTSISNTDSPYAVAAGTRLSSLTLANAGTGGTYAVNDILTVVGGVFTLVATIRVTAVSTGQISEAEIEIGGDYSIDPDRVENAASGGSGSGATFNLTLSPDRVILADPSNGEIVLTLPALAGTPEGKVLTIKDAGGAAGSNPVTVDPSGETIDGEASVTLSENYEVLSIVKTSTGWARSDSEGAISTPTIDDVLWQPASMPQNLEV